MKQVVLWAVVLWCSVACVVGDDDDDFYCHDDSGKRIPTDDCPHNCCINDTCGSSSECSKVLIIVLAVLGGVLFCGTVVGVFICYRCKYCCFKEKTCDPYPEAAAQGPVAGHQAAGQSSVGYPAHQGAHPAAQGARYPPPPPLAIQGVYMPPAGGYHPPHANKPSFNRPQNQAQGSRPSAPSAY